jgi:TPR repeat protein
MRARFLGPWWRRLARLLGASAQYTKYVDEVTATATAEIIEICATLRKRAEQGNPDSQYILGTFYEYGQCPGVPQDYAWAAAWYGKAAAQEHPGAEFNLGAMWANGHGVPQDYAQAAVWYRFAADHGHADAQYNLGLLYAKGEGVPQDNAEAYFWFDIAAAGKQDAADAEAAAKDRDQAASYLTPADLSRVQERARKWFEDHAAKP